MKKIIAVFLTVLMIAALMPMAFADATPVNIVITDPGTVTIGLPLNIQFAVQNSDHATISDPNAVVTVTFGSASTTINNTSGTAEFSTTGKAAGTYEVTVSFAGDAVYASATKTINVTLADPVNHDVTVTHGEHGSASATPTQAKLGETVTLTATPDTGYTLDAWTSSEVTVSENTFTMPDNAVSVNATFKPATYKVTLVTNGGTISSGDVTSYTYLTGATLPTSSDISRNGYRFDGWYNNEGCTGTEIKTIATTETGDKTFYAKWTPYTYTVKLNPVGGTLTGDVTSYTAGTGVTLPTTITKTNYSFGGWYENEACTGTAVTAITATDYGNKEYWAKWNPVYTVSFNSNGGSAVTNQRVVSGSTATKPADPIYTGYSLVGWYTDSALTQAFDFSTPITKDTLLYAKWKISAHTVTMGKYSGGNLGKAYYSTDGSNWIEVTSTSGMAITVENGAVLYFKMDPYSGYYRHPYIQNANGTYYSPYVANGTFSLTVDGDKIVKLNFSTTVPTGDASMWQYVVAALASAGTATGIVFTTKRKNK